MRLNKLIDKNALRTRNLKNGEKPYKIEELVDENGNLRNNVILDESNAGTHGRKNFFSDEDNAETRALKYFNVKYSRPSRQDMMQILEENPYNRSGVLVTTPDFHYSIDSFKVGLNNLEKNLRQGRRFHPLKTDNTYSLANNYG